MVNIAVLVSGGGTNLQALIDAEKSDAIQNGKITAVISSKPDAYALTRARTTGIDTYVVPRANFPDRDSFTDAIIAQLQKTGAGLVVLSGFMYILSPSFAQTYQGRVINVHPALIPSFCGDGFYGLRVHEKALEYGVKLTGATVHFVTEETDGGPIIMQKAVEIMENDTPETLQRRVMEQAEWVILPQAVNLFCQGRLEIAGRKVLIKEEPQ